jgi:hypothetical protein
MSGVQPYIDTEPDLDVEGRAILGTRGVCGLCGIEGDTLAGPIELPGPQFVTGWRCCETAECRKRRMQPFTVTEPDVPKENPNA